MTRILLSIRSRLFMRNRSRLALLILLPVWGMHSSTVLAQQQQAQPSAQNDERLEEVVVTGSRITGFTSPTPVMSLTSQDIELTSATNVGDLVNEIPVLQPTTTPTVSTSSGINAGGNSFDVRGLGRLRTLTLVDGRRHVPNRIEGTVDSNVIPSGIVERLEVVTGGASAAYGSDALAGVVNIVLRDDFEGFEGSARTGRSSKGDYDQLGVALTYGARFGADDRGRILLAGEYRDSDGASRQGSRDWAQGAWGVVGNADFVPGMGQFRRLVTQNARVGNATFGGLITSGTLAGTRFLDDGTPAPFDPGSNPFGSASTIGGDGPDLTGMRALAVALQRETIYAKLEYEITKDISAFIEAGYANSKGENDGYINTFHAGGGALTISQDNAFLDDSLRAMMVAAGENSFRLGRINSDIPAFGTHGENESWQFYAGLNGSLGDTWSWDAYVAYGDNEEVNTSFNDLNTANLVMAVDAVVNPANGEIVCRSTLTSPNNGCVPVNMFGSGSPSVDAINYITDTYPNTVTYRQDVASFTVEGRPFSSWAGPISLATGLEYRREEFTQNTDPVSEAGNHLLVNWIASSGKVSFREAFMEGVVPLLADSPLGSNLELNAAFRAADQSLTGVARTWKVGVIYDLNEQFRIRASRSRDIRSPNFTELSVTPPAGITSVVDLNGVTSIVFQPQLPNPNLDPEEADTLTAGIVYRPGWGRGLAVSADYYEIDLSGVITRFGAQTIVNACATDPAFCEFLIRDPAGNLVEVQRLNINAGSGLTNGVDFEISYQVDADRLFLPAAGTLTFRVLGNYARHNNSEIGGAFSESIGDDWPHWRANGSVTYIGDRLSLRLAGRYAGELLYDDEFGPEDINIQKFPGRLYLNAGFEYDLTESGSISIFGNIDNLLDRDPPIIPETTRVTPTRLTRVEVHDTLGRRYMVGVRVRL